MFVRRRTWEALHRQHARELERRDQRIDKLVEQVASLAGHTLPQQQPVVWEGPKAEPPVEYIEDDLVQFSDEELAGLN